MRRARPIAPLTSPPLAVDVRYPDVRHRRLTNCRFRTIASRTRRSNPSATSGRSRGAPTHDETLRTVG